VADGPITVIPADTTCGVRRDPEEIETMFGTTAQRTIGRLAAVAFATTTVVAGLTATAAPAGAVSTIAQQQAKAAAIRAQIDAESMHVAQLAEQYNGAKVAVEAAQAKVAAAQAGVAAAQARRDELKSTLARRAASLYRGAGNQSPFASVDANNMVKTARIAQYGDVAAKKDRTLLAEVRAAQARLTTEKAAAETARADAAQQAASASAAYNAASAADRALRNQLSQIDAETQRLIAQQRAEAARVEAARLAELARIAAQQRAAARPGSPAPTPTTRPRTTGATGSPGSPITTSTTVSPALNGSPFGPPPAVSPKAAGAVAFARAQLGKPYVFATSGPDTFDCSGLTMAAWASVGVRMAHYSGSQAVAFPKIAYQDLQPGDLVLFYSDLHHVGIYIGGGMMIHAPQTGDVVKIASAWRSNFMWGVRPS
jgi:cell wall-associated NlpC family hydrolase